ncbi:MurR/RpiR family transcriptional regulator [Actinocatenispora comari]|uniref:RpiR family transcriptional regulator n=1 Tax=Actinocatenispora comari TaxID=2807577 RepID=A0A8J4EMQ6_9ACTN|nr:MurR/RpiR family transcriptional regulator [Actinocatenispora comari]GIL29811.1 RpiR family transcriptional regulator [Actinocatenispora comari]
MTGSGEPAGRAARPAGVLAHIRTLLPSMAPAERRVGEAVLGQPSVVVGRTITELAESCHTSETTVIRFCRTVGFRGYPELRLTLATELGRDAARGDGHKELGADIGRADSLREVVEKIGYADARGVEDTVTQLDLDALAKVVDAVATADRINLFGIGASGFAANDLQRKLYRIGRNAFFFADPHDALVAAALLRPGDVEIGLTHTGTTVETVNVLREARRHDAVAVAITNNGGAPAAAEADLVLTTAARETTFRSGAMASRIAQLAIVDCIFVAVAQRTYDDTLDALRLTFRAVDDVRTKKS